MSTERFDIRHAPAPRESFRLLYISKSRFGGDWNSTVHTHSCTELFYCLSGEGQFLLSGQLFPVKPDDMVIVNPQVEHTELSLNASPLEYIVLGVSGIEILFGKADSTYAIFNCRENRERMVTLLHMLLAEADRSLDGCETVCQDLLEVLLIWLVRCTRIHDYRELLAKIEKRGMDTEGMDDYLNTFKYGMPPHGGLGIGLERMTMQLLGEENVREVSLFPRDMSRLVP